MSERMTIDWLLEQGRDPLEVLLVPQADDVRQVWEREQSAMTDKRLSAALKTMPNELQARLVALIAEREKRAATAAAALWRARAESGDKLLRRITSPAVVIYGFGADATLSDDIAAHLAAEPAGAVDEGSKL